MALDPITTIYISMGMFMFIVLFIGLLVIAGKDILFAFKRRISPKGCDVFVINSNRQMSQYYKTPTDGIFMIQKKMYITNPDKLTSLSPEMLEKVKKSVQKKKEKMQLRILEFTEKMDKAQESLKLIPQTSENKAQIDQYNSYLHNLKQRIKVMESKLEEKEQLYYHKRRAAFFYIEGDPIPKDFHELYTEMDSIAIDNVIARSMTKDPKAVKDLEKELKMIKFLVIVSIIAAGAAAILVFSLKGDIQLIGKAVGQTIIV